MGEGLIVLELVQVFPRRAVAPMHRSLQFGIKHSKKPVTRLATLSRYLSAYAKGQERTMVPTGSFAP